MDLDHDACFRALRQRDARFDGRFFTGVRTTGVYCRPVCPAPTPKPENAVFFASAAAAQSAGFRPCLRCRPETAPEIGAWRGAANSVSRALALIDLGALDRDGAAALAERLGLGERQLRRLFQKYLGAAPGAVARARRILLARQLLHETTLNVADVAFAAGFQSLRRFNEAFAAAVGRPPGAMRRAAGPVAEPTDGAIRLTLRSRPPYDWASTLACLAQRAIPRLESVMDGRYRRAIALDGAQGAILVDAAPGAALRLTAHLPELSALPGVIARVRRLFDLGADPLAIAEDFSRDNLLAPLVAARPGLRAPGDWDGFEGALRALLDRDALARLVARFGATLPSPLDGVDRMFPSPQALASAEALGLAPRQCAAVSALAAAFLADSRLFEPAGPLETKTRRLAAIEGIDADLAALLAQRQFCPPDAFDAEDPAVLRALAALEGRPFTPELLRARAERWRPWRAYAEHHLRAFDAVQNPTVAKARDTPRKALEPHKNPA